MKESVIYSEELLKIINADADSPIKFNWVNEEF